LFLIEEGIDLTLSDKAGNNALIQTIVSQDGEMISILIEKV